jgi:hypothetical protein
MWPEREGRLCKLEAKVEFASPFDETASLVFSLFFFFERNLILVLVPVPVVLVFVDEDDPAFGCWYICDDASLLSEVDPIVVVDLLADSFGEGGG